MRRRFVRRMFFGALALLLVLASFAFLGALLWHGGWNGEADRRGGFFPFGFLFAGGLVVVFLVVGRAVRRAAGSAGDVMEAVGRVAEGDLSARVTPRGSGDDRRLAQAFNRMADRLETDEARRREVLADIAHELRTPLSVIRGNVEAMLDGLYSTDAEHLRTVLDEADILARLLEDLRTLSTADAGALVLHREAVEPRELVKEAAAAFGARAAEKGIELRANAAEGVPTIEIDPVRIGQVLANLLQNAVGHTPEGGTVGITARRGSLDGEPAVELVVEDTGRGVPPDLLPSMFDRFVKSADSGGSGLGLAIAKSLVEAHGGRITAHSPTNGGTAVSVTLPVRPE
jgi:two-component system sensor histidine kinase BaeS